MNAHVQGGTWSSRCLRGGLLLVSMVVTSGRAAPAQETIDRVMAVVAGEPILLSDVRAAEAFGIVDPGPASDVGSDVLSRLIDRALILDEVDRYAPPDPTPEDIDRAMVDVRKRFDSSAAFAHALALAGIDERQVREMVRQNLRIRAYINQRFAADTPERGQAMAAAWVAGLRRRATIFAYPAPSAGTP